MHTALTYTYMPGLANVTFKGSKIIWFRNTCILINFINMIPALGTCEDTLTPDPWALSPVF